jgi:hypothetical protein
MSLRSSELLSEQPSAPPIDAPLVRPANIAAPARNSRAAGEPSMRPPRRGPALTKAELRAQGDAAVAAATKPVTKLPTKLSRQCGRCGEITSVMIEPGAETPPFKCKSCDK